MLREHDKFVYKDFKCIPAIVESSVRWWMLAADDDDDAQCWNEGFTVCGLVCAEMGRATIFTAGPCIHRSTVNLDLRIVSTQS